jgi:hypothetical protein
MCRFQDDELIACLVWIALGGPTKIQVEGGKAEGRPVVCYIFRKKIIGKTWKKYNKNDNVKMIAA